MRQLKYHEKKLLRKVSLYQWKGDDNIRVAKILRRYHIQNREDYVAYTKICGQVTKLANKLKTLPADDAFRIAMTDQLLDKLFNIGILTTTKSLKKAEEITVSATAVRLFCACRAPTRALSVLVSYLGIIHLPTTHSYRHGADEDGSDSQDGDHVR